MSFSTNPSLLSEPFASSTAHLISSTYCSPQRNYVNAFTHLTLSHLVGLQLKLSAIPFRSLTRNSSATVALGVHLILLQPNASCRFISLSPSTVLALATFSQGHVKTQQTHRLHLHLPLLEHILKLGNYLKTVRNLLPNVDNSTNSEPRLDEQSITFLVQPQLLWIL